MRSPLLRAATLTVLLVAATACGTTDSTVDGAAPPTTGEVVTTTTEPDEVTSPTQPAEPPGSSAPPTTVAPTTTPAPATPTTVRPSDTEDITIDDGTFESVAEMGETASLVVVGDVVEVTSLGRPLIDRDPDADEFVAITVKTVDTLKGEPIGEIVFAWQAFATDDDGNRTATLLVNGIRPPDVADRLLLFLHPADPAMADFFGGGLTHQIVKLDGIAYVDGDRIIAGEVGSHAAERLVTMTVSEIRDALIS